MSLTALARPVWGSRWPLLLTATVWSYSFALFAATPPNVIFSASPTVECRDVTPPEFAQANPYDKLVEATFRVSILLSQGTEDALQEILIVIASPEGRLRVAEFSPKTESVTDIVGPIERTESNDSTRTLEAGVGGSVGGKYGPVSAQLSPSLSAGQSEHNGVKESYKQLPPKRLLLASGTTDGDHGVFFKLKPSTQTSLQGSRHFTCLFVVPRQWRGDWLALSCVARAETRRQFVRRIEDCGRATFCIGLHLEGDAEARRLARQLDGFGDLPAATLSESGIWDGSSIESDLNEAAPTAPRSLAASTGGAGLPTLWRVYRKVFAPPQETSAARAEAAGRQARPTPADTRQALARLSGAAGADQRPELP